MLCRQLVRQGRFLFRWRGVLPLVLLPIALLASFQSGQFAHWFGEPVEEAWEVLCASFCLVGLAVRALTVGFAPAGRSGRATRAQRAERLNTTGLYSITRHPLYLGNFLVFLGFVLLTKVWWFPLPAILAFALYYERIILAEEAFLAQRFGKTYTRWALRTPAFFPVCALWRRPDLSFSVRTVLRREYASLCTAVVGLSAVEMASDVLGEQQSVTFWLRDDIAWVVLLLVGTTAAFFLRLLKKRTRWLAVPGR